MRYKMIKRGDDYWTGSDFSSSQKDARRLPVDASGLDAVTLNTLFAGNDGPVRTVALKMRDRTTEGDDQCFDSSL